MNGLWRALTHGTAFALLDRRDPAARLRPGDLVWLPWIGLVIGLVLVGAFVPMSTLFLPLDLALWLVLALQFTLFGGRPELGFAGWCQAWGRSDGTTVLSGAEFQKSRHDMVAVAAFFFLLMGRWLVYRQWFPQEIWPVLLAVPLLLYSVPLCLGFGPPGSAFDSKRVILRLYGAATMVLALLIAAGLRVNPSGGIFLRSWLVLTLAALLCGVALMVTHYMVRFLVWRPPPALCFGLGVPMEMALLLALSMAAFLTL